MKISPISVSNYHVTSKNFNRSNVKFQGKHTCAKFLGGVFGTAGTLGALGGIAIMTGGVSLIPTLAYGALCGGAGAFIGHKIDKGVNDKK